MQKHALDNGIEPRQALLLFMQLETCNVIVNLPIYIVPWEPLPILSHPLPNLSHPLPNLSHPLSPYPNPLPTSPNPLAPSPNPLLPSPNPLIPSPNPLSQNQNTGKGRHELRNIYTKGQCIIYIRMHNAIVADINVVELIVGGVHCNLTIRRRPIHRPPVPIRKQLLALKNLLLHTMWNTHLAVKPNLVCSSNQNNQLVRQHKQPEKAPKQGTQATQNTRRLTYISTYTSTLHWKLKLTIGHRLLLPKPRFSAKIGQNACRKEPKKIRTIPINWFKSVFKITGYANCFENNLRLWLITGFSD